MINCPKCNISFEEKGKWGLKKFCSRKCANSHTRSDASKLKTGLSLVGRPGHHKNKGRELVEHIDKNCLECQKLFRVTINNPKKYCSDKCSRRNRGGYRLGSGRSKSGYYKGIYCASTYELCWVIYRLDHNLPVKRFEGYILYNENKEYYPDFIIDKTIYEIKGWYQHDGGQNIEDKCKAAQDAGYEIYVLYKKDLQKEFDWVEEKYNTKEYYELYDNYKPKYVYICNYCKKEFSKQYKAKTEIKYCCRRCAGKGNTSITNPNGNNQFTKNTLR
jgi:hypothetical protein